MRTGSAKLLCLVIWLAGWMAGAAAAELSARLGDRAQEKIDAVARNAAGNPVRPRTTPITEAELNSYLAFNLKGKIPAGLSDPRLTLVGDGAVAGRVLLDMDEYKRNRRSRGVADPFNYLTGRVPLTARGVLRTARGQGQFQLAAAELGGIPLPKPLVQELVTFFTRTKDTPNGVDLEAPFELPAKVRQIVIKSAEAVVIQ